MAGSYGHCVDAQGRLRDCESLAGMLDTPGDVAEAVEELFGMIWYLARGDAALVAEARANFRLGLETSPGVADCEPCAERDRRVRDITGGSGRYYDDEGDGGLAGWMARGA